MWLRRMMQHVGNEAEMNLEGGFQGIFQAFVPLGARLEVRKLRCPRIGREDPHTESRLHPKVRNGPVGTGSDHRIVINSFISRWNVPRFQARKPLHLSHCERYMLAVKAGRWMSHYRLYRILIGLRAILPLEYIYLHGISFSCDLGVVCTRMQPDIFLGCTFPPTTFITISPFYFRWTRQTGGASHGVRDLLVGNMRDALA